jgi:hypothetical protein
VHGSTLQLNAGADGIQEAADGSLVVSRSPNNGLDHLEVVDPASGQVREQGPELAWALGGPRWALSQDRAVAVAGGAPVDAEDGGEILIWRLGTPVTTLRRVPVGAAPSGSSRAVPPSCAC